MTALDVPHPQRGNAVPRFVITMGREEIDTYSLVQERVLIGRSSKADIILDNLMISRKHAEVRRLGTDFMIVNLAGKNGVFVNGKWVDTSPLRNGDSIDIGKYSIRFDYPKDEKEKLLAEDRKEAGAALKVSTTEMLARIEGGDPDKAERQRKLAQAAALETNVETFQLAPDELAKVREKMNLAKRAHLQVSSVPPQVVGLGDRTTLGKGAECSVKLDTGWLAPKMSAAIALRSNEYLLEVLGGTVKLNGEKVKGNSILNDEDAIEIEGIKIRFHDKA